MQAILRYGQFTAVLEVTSPPPYRLSVIEPPGMTKLSTEMPLEVTTPATNRLNFMLRRIINSEYAEYEYEGK